MIDNGVEGVLAATAHWYLSFVKDGKFAGACLVSADSGLDAVSEAWRLGCNPGGEVCMTKLDYSDPDCTARPSPDQFGKLFQRNELEALFGPCRKLGEE